jgi:Na+-transporting methylmalonyl-CoA/oxaloacetate decarboxylase gamma subunit
MNSEVQNIENKEKGDGKKKLLIGIVIAVIAILLCSVVAMASLLAKTNKAGEKAEEPKEEPRKVITPDTAEEVVEEILSEEPLSNVPSSYTVTQNGTWTFENGDAETKDAYVANDIENETPIYFDLIVDETEEIIYSSPVLELGAELDSFKLDKHLEKGTYNCTVLYHLIDEDQNTLTTTRIGVTVVVEN